MEDLALSGGSVLVTGAFGLVGRWLVAALVDSGVRVVALRRDYLDQVLPAWLGEVVVVHGDVCDPGLVARVLAEYEVEGVFHLAAQTLVGVARTAPLATFETNIRGTWVLLEACRLHGVRRVVVASSDKAYGPAAELPYREAHCLRPLSPYDVSKAAADLIARSYWHTFRLPVAVTRLANVFGGGDFNGSRLVPEVVSAALGGRAPEIRSDGSPERDFLYVSDAVRAYLAVWRAVGSGEGCGEAFNAGSGRPVAVREVVSLICRLAGSSVEPVFYGSGVPEGEIDRQWVDSSALRALTGWEPLVSLEEGLRRTVEWYRQHSSYP